MEQIEWGDAEIGRKQRTSDPVANPPGFYVYLLRANFPVPSNFETSRKRRLQEEARQKEMDSRARQAQKELELYEQRERYEAFLTGQTDAHIKERIAAGTIERLLRTHMKKIKDECPQYRWPEPALREFAWRKLRQEIADELNLPTFEEFVEQRAHLLF
jgi:hypothetical protein